MINPNKCVDIVKDRERKPLFSDFLLYLVWLKYFISDIIAPREYIIIQPYTCFRRHACSLEHTGQAEQAQDRLHLVDVRGFMGTFQFGSPIYT